MFAVEVVTKLANEPEGTRGGLALSVSRMQIMSLAVFKASM
jgi:hypothetical protein